MRCGTLTIDETGGAPGEYRVLTVDDFEAEQSIQRVLFGLYFGLLLAVGVYHVLMFAVLGGFEFLTYGLYMGALLLLEVARTEYVDVLLQGAAVDHHAVLAYCIALLAVAGYAFFNTFLRLAQTQPGLNRALAVLAGVDVLAAAVSARVADVRLDAAELIIALVALAVGLVGAGRALGQGERSARYLLLAYSGFVVGLAALLARRFFPRLPAMTAAALALGAALAALTLALGAADYIADAKEERDEPQLRPSTSTARRPPRARFVPQGFCRCSVAGCARSRWRSHEPAHDRAVHRRVVLDALRDHGAAGDVRLRQSAAAHRTDHWRTAASSTNISAMRSWLFPAAYDALAAGFEMQAAIGELNREREAAGRTPIAMGIGIHVGDVVLGTVGEIERMDGTAIGDAVNLASRLEGLTKIYGCTVLISDDAACELSDAQRDGLRFLGRIAVKGKSVPVGLYEALDCEPAEQREEKLRTRPMFDAGIEALGRGAFTLAAECFDAVIIDNPMDGPATHLAERSRELELRPEHWAGFDHATEK